MPLTTFIIHQTHYEKSDWSRAFNHFTIACELDMINAISATDIAFMMSSSTSAWLPSPLGVFSSETEWLNTSLLLINVYKGFFYFNVYFIQTKVLLYFNRFK